MKRAQKRYIIISFLAIISVCFVVFSIVRSRSFQLFGRIVNEVKTNQKIIALTFDDGPAQNTEAILEILKKYNVSASFFLTGKEMSEHPGITKRIVTEGHNIGNHSWSHSRMVFKSNAFIENEIEKTDKLIRQVGYTKEIYFRPPYCKKFIYLPWYLKKTNRLTVTWNIEPDSDPDTENNASLILNEVKKQAKPGAILLLHAAYSNRQTSLDALPAIIEWLQQNGYSLLTLDELLKAGAN